MSISDPGAVMAGRVRFLPKGIDLTAYKTLLNNPDVWQKYLNSIWIVVIGTSINIIVTMMAAYPLSRKEFRIGKYFMLAITITMFFSGGLIPFYLQVRTLGLFNSRWSLILPVATSAWYIIIARSYLQTIPDSIIESARIDGAKEFKILLKLILPMSMPIVAVIGLFAAVSFWNSWFNAMLFISNKKLHPIQYYLVQILVQNKAEGVMMDNLSVQNAGGTYREMLKYAIIILTIVPIMCVYPFAQKYFIKGMLIGSIKE